MVRAVALEYNPDLTQTTGLLPLCCSAFSFQPLNQIFNWKILHFPTSVFNTSRFCVCDFQSPLQIRTRGSKTLHVEITETDQEKPRRLVGTYIQFLEGC